MTQMIILIGVLLVLHVPQSQTDTVANCRDNVTLHCPAVRSDDMDFNSLAWYKICKNKKEGIIRKSKDDDTVLKYNLTWPATFGARHSLLLSNVMPTFSGTYECSIMANVGGRNEKGRVNLKINECQTKAEMTTNTWTTNAPSLVTVRDLPVIWTSTGYAVLAMAKILLSFIIVWAIHTMS